MFVEMLRNEDLTERAETARQVTSSASEPEEDFPSAEAIDSPADETPEITPFAEDFETAQQSEAVSEPGPEPERSEGASEESVVSEALQPVSEPDSQVSIPEVFSEELSDTETIQPRQESGEPAELSSSYTEEGVVAQPAMSEESPVARMLSHCRLHLRTMRMPNRSRSSQSQAMNRSLRRNLGRIRNSRSLLRP